VQPHQFPRRVLLCVSGNSPQIITETLYALAVESGGKPPFVPTEIRVLTTARGAEQTRLSLLAEDRAMLARLCEDYGLEGIRFDDGCIEVFQREDGTPLQDIVTPDDNRIAADHITRRVAELTADPDAAIHASIAGGRKTMGFYLGYAMSLYGREQDRVSHVLVSEGFTEHREFFFKPRKPRTLQGPHGWEMSTADAKIHLAEIPLVRLRSSEFDALSERRLGFAEAVARASRLADGVELRIRMDRSAGEGNAKCVVSLGGEALKLTQTQGLVLHWFALRRLRGEHDGSHGRVMRAAFKYPRHSSRSMGYLDELFALASTCYGEMSQVYASIDESLGGTQSALQREPCKWLEPLISGVNKAIRKQFGDVGVRRYGIGKDGVRGEIAYFLAQKPSLIVIEDPRKETSS
jgi:CRISPR-associated protein (TIGR02584 family)